MTVSQTILSQLGGNKFLAMTGAKNLVGSDNSLRFDLPRGAKNKANKVQVVLGADDTYSVEFYRYNARALDCPMLSKKTGIYVEMLRSVFTAETGFVCAL